MAKINYEALPSRTCEYCKKEYKPTGPAQKTCTTCRKHIESVTSQVYHDIARIKKYGTHEGIGSGNTQGRGKEHHSYKNGTGLFLTLRKQVREEVRYCEDCGKDLKDVSKYHWCVHHIDYDRTHNDRENLKLLCKRCHQVEHDCIRNIAEGATTISKESTPK